MTSNAAMTRSQLRSTLVVSQLPVENWHPALADGDPTLADAILDRLVHNAHRIDLAGASMRKTKTIKPETTGEDNNSQKGKA